MSSINLPASLSFIQNRIQELGFSGIGYNPSTRPLSFQKYFEWIEKDQMGEMVYLKNHMPVKEDLKKINPQINSIFSLTHPYRLLTHENQTPFQYLKIAMYAQDQDYHDWLKEKLQLVIQDLQRVYPHEFFLGVTDIYPVLERDFAYQSEQGWIGKNSCLIHPQKGSLFLIGNILSSLNIPNPQLKNIHDFCGKCTSCIEACPTQAIESDKTLNSELCISYWTIESKKIAPESIRTKIGDHFFGCDICQTVCPWNQKILKSLALETSDPSPPISEGLLQELKFILEASSEELNKKTKGTALYRSKSFGLKRNALFIIANLKLKDFIPVIEKLQDQEKLKELCRWTLAELQSKT